MGLNINAVALMASLEGHGGRMLTLGRQRILFSAEQLERALGAHVGGTLLDDAAVFRALGYSVVESVDVSTYEGATHVIDLNVPLHRPDMFGAYDAVFTGGTLEHVFDVAQALRTTASLLKIGGRLIHVGPVNGWIDHGFYQLCPTWILDYFGANGWRVVSSALVDRMSDREGKSVWRVRPAHHRRRVEGAKQLHFCVAERLESSTVDRNPIQSRYRRKFGEGEHDGAQIEFRAYDLVGGRAGEKKDGIDRRGRRWRRWFGGPWVGRKGGHD